MKVAAGQLRRACKSENRLARRKDHFRSTLLELRDTKPIRTASMARAELASPTDLKTNAVRDIPAALRALLADVFALYLKTKNFHWHMSGSHFRDYHLMLDEQSDQIFAITDDIAERARKIGGTAIRSTGQIAREQRILDNDADYVEPQDMLAELRGDNQQLTAEMRRVHELCDEYGDVATASLLENWIDEAERRVWFLYEAARTGPHS
jgi:starvation-inducible DNA-binding protein